MIRASARPDRNTNRIPIEENTFIFRIKLSIKAKIAVQEVTPQLIISGSSIFASFLLMIEKEEKKKAATMINKSPK
jgi:hypothetical protein